MLGGPASKALQDASSLEESTLPHAVDMSAFRSGPAWVAFVTLRRNVTTLKTGGLVEEIPPSGARANLKKPVTFREGGPGQDRAPHVSGRLRCRGPILLEGAPGPSTCASDQAELTTSHGCAGRCGADVAGLRPDGRLSARLGRSWLEVRFRVISGPGNPFKAEVTGFSFHPPPEFWAWQPAGVHSHIVDWGPFLGVAVWASERRMCPVCVPLPASQ